MSYLDGNNETIEPVPEAGPEKIAGEESPEGVDDDLDPADLFSFFKKQLCRKTTIAVVLFHMIVIVGVGIMQEIAREQADARIFFRDEGFVDDVEAPGAFFPVTQAKLSVGIPAAVADPLSAIIIQPVHQIAIPGKALYLFPEDAFAQLFAQQLIGVQK